MKRKRGQERFVDVVSIDTVNKDFHHPGGASIGYVSADGRDLDVTLTLSAGRYWTWKEGSGEKGRGSDSGGDLYGRRGR